MEYKGKAFVFGNDVDTDVIIPAHYLNTTDPDELASHCMEGADPEFPNKVKPGDIMVAGKNFGCGSSREHAPIAIKALGVNVVIAGSFARIFYRNSFNMGLILVESFDAVDKISDTDEISVNIQDGVITNITTGQEFPFDPIPEFMLELVNNGGLIPYLMKKRSA